MALQHLRSSTANKRPIPTVMSSGQIAINTNEASPGLFFKDSNGDLVKVGPVHIGTDAPNSSPASTAATALVAGTTYQILTVGTTDFTLVGASANTVGVIFTATGAGTGTGTVSGQQGVEKGEQWLDITGGAYDLKIYDGTAWRSQAGEFVNTTGDTMTGALLLDNAASAAAPDLSFDGDADTGIYSPAADEFGIATAGTAAVTVDSSQNVGIGVTSPDGLLTLNATPSNTPNLRFQNQSASADAALSTYGDASGVNLVVGTNAYVNSAGATVKFDAAEETAFVNFARTGVIQIRTGDGSSEAVRIDSSGNVGIGTTSPARTLHVQGDARVGPSGGQYILLAGDASNNSIISRDGVSSTSGHPLVFSTGTGASAESMRIDSSGRLLVGTSASLTGSAMIQAYKGSGSCYEDPRWCPRL